MHIQDVRVISDAVRTARDLAESIHNTTSITQAKEIAKRIDAALAPVHKITGREAKAALHDIWKELD